MTRGDDKLDGKTVPVFLRMALGARTRPVDQLIERLCAKNGAEWFEAQIGETVTGIAGQPSASIGQVLAAAQTELAEIEAIKEAAKRRVTQSGDTRHAALLIYLLAVAAALAHHGQAISSQPEAEIRDALLDLAEHVSAPWAELLGKAALRS